MQILIDIPEKMYQNVLNGTYCGTLYRELKNGTPLPKGHGDLIDVNRKITISTYDEQYEEWSEETLTVREALNKWSDEGVGVKDVIIQADNGESEDAE